MSFEITKKPKDIIKIYGQSYEVDRPSVKQMIDFVEKTKEQKGNEAQESIKLLASLGLPESVISELQADDFAALTKYIFESKKN